MMDGVNRFIDIGIRLTGLIGLGEALPQFPSTRR